MFQKNHFLVRLFVSFCLFVVFFLHAKADPSDQRFGVMTHFAQGWDPAWTSLVAERAIPTVRDELYWNQVETQKGVYSFPQAFDNYMAALKQKQISPLIVLSFENDNYDGGNTPYTDEGFAAYGRYGVQVLRHYGNQINAVEIWNEYNGSFCKGPAADDRTGTYSKMLKQAYAQIKAERPDVTVLGGSTAGVPLPYWEKLMANGALNSMDALSIHPYRYDAAPEGIETDIVSLQNLVKKYNGGQTKPIWISEIGWEIQDSSNGQLAIDEATQAKFLVRAYALLLSANVERVYWYLFRDYQEFTMGLTYPDGTPKQSAFAMQAMIQELSGAHFVKRETTAANVYSLVFAKADGKEVRVMWSLQPTTIPATGQTRVVDIKGNVLATTGQLNLTDTPLFVEGALQGVPGPLMVETLLTTAASGFSSTPGQNGWSYGAFVGATTLFVPLNLYSVTDWSQNWSGPYSYLRVTPSDQHPSVLGLLPVSSVRRWTSNISGTVHVVGQFQSGTQGDGVGVSILVNGQSLSRDLIGGGTNTLHAFDFQRAVQPGTTIDFAVDPGPGLNINFDATTVTVTIDAENGT